MRPMGSLHRRAILRMVAGLPVLLAARRSRAQDEPGLEPDHPLASVTARYGSLASYSDTGTVETTYQWPGTPALVERHRFETLYRAPRNFFFRFDQDPAAGGDALVIWCDGGDFQSWWKATGIHEVHGNGQGAIAFLNASSPTKDAANLIAPHLFPQAMLPGPSYRLIGAREEGEEWINGRACRLVSADQRVTGVQTVEDRPTRVWVDKESELIVQVRVDAETGSPEGFLDRKIFSIDPVADPALPDERFTFIPPGNGP